MSTLDDLRSTLARHADDVDDTERFTRAAAVNDRVRAVRLRRVVVAAAAVVVVLATAAGAVGLLGNPHRVEPANRLGNVDVPAEVQLSERTFALDEVRAVEPGVETTLPRAGVVPDAAVSLVGTGLGSGRATLVMGTGQVARLSGHLDHSPAIPYNLEPTITIEVVGAPAGAKVGIAVYRATGTTTEHGVFQRRSGVTELAATALSDPGESSAELTVRAAANQVTLAAYCSSDAEDLQVNVTVDGAEESGEPCSQARVDHGYSGGMALGPGVHAREHTVRVYLTRTSDDKEVSVPGVVVGVGAYLPGPGPDPVGVHVATTVEWFGRTWTLEKFVTSDHAGAMTSATISTGEQERLLRLVSTGSAKATWTGRLGTTVSARLGARSGDAYNPLLLPGDTYDVEVTPGSGTEVAILVYRPA
jgi:hypothetical protein